MDDILLEVNRQRFRRGVAPSSRRLLRKVYFSNCSPWVQRTNLAADNRAVARLYNKRGTAEQWIKGGQAAVKMARLGAPERLL
jgi:hypothetical protein